MTNEELEKLHRGQYIKNRIDSLNRLRGRLENGGRVEFSIYMGGGYDMREGISERMIAPLTKVIEDEIKELEKEFEEL